MLAKSLILAVLVFRAAFAQGPAYTASGIVNSADYSSGPFAPNSVLTIFGSNLCWYTMAWSSGALTGQLDGTSVYVNGALANVLYVSPSQVNFIVPDNLTGSSFTVRVTR